MKGLPLYKIKALEPCPLQKGDEIIFDGQNWIVHVVDLEYMGGRDYETVGRAIVTLQLVEVNEIWLRKEIRITLYPQWFIEQYPADDELRKIPEFQYQTVGKRTWGQVWMKLSE